MVKNSFVAICPRLLDQNMLIYAAILFFISLQINSKTKSIFLVRLTFLVLKFPNWYIFRLQLSYYISLILLSKGSIIQAESSSLQCYVCTNTETPGCSTSLTSIISNNIKYVSTCPSPSVCGVSIFYS